MAVCASSVQRLRYGRLCGVRYSREIIEMSTA